MLSRARGILARQAIHRHDGRTNLVLAAYLNPKQGSWTLSSFQLRKDIIFGNTCASFHNTVAFAKTEKHQIFGRNKPKGRRKDLNLRERRKGLAGRLSKAIADQTHKAIEAQERRQKKKGQHSPSTAKRKEVQGTSQKSDQKGGLLQSVWSQIISTIRAEDKSEKGQDNIQESKDARVKSRNEIRRDKELKSEAANLLDMMKSLNNNKSSSSSSDKLNGENGNEKRQQNLRYRWSSDIKIPESKNSNSNQTERSSKQKEHHQLNGSHQAKEPKTSTQGQHSSQPNQSIENRSPPRHGRDNNERQYRQTSLLTGAEMERARVARPNPKAIETGKRNVGDYLPSDLIPSPESPQIEKWNDDTKWTTPIGGILSYNEVGIEEVKPLRRMDVATLAHGLDRVLFNPGVHWLRDERSGIYNFDPKIRNLYDVDLFDYSALPPYLTSSIDEELAQLTRKHAKRYSGSTSSLTSLLSHIYFCISSWKHPPLTGFTEGFQNLPKGFSFGAMLPANIILRRFEDDALDGSQEKSVRYAVDNDKSGEGQENNNYVLTQLGKSVEKLLTSDMEEYEKYLRINSHKLSKEEKTKKEAYYYSMSDKFMMRSQLDCSDDRLPRKTFDLKTRAVIAVRQDRANWVESSGYMIRHNTGVQESFERELWDMSRGALLKYFFQARIGNMDGILVAYHSTSTVFGFQYLSREDLAQKIFSSEEMAEQAFRLSLGMLEKILDAATLYFPSETLRITMDAQNDHLGKEESHLKVFITPESGEKVESKEKETSMEKNKTLLLDVQVDRYLSEALVHGPVDFSQPKGYAIDVSKEDEIARRERSELPPLEWKVEYSVTPRSDLSQEETEAKLEKVQNRRTGVASLLLPNVEALNERERERELQLSKNPEALEKFLEDRRTGKAAGMPLAPGQFVLGINKKVTSEEESGSNSEIERGEADLGSQGETINDEQISNVHLVSIDSGDHLTARADIPERPIAQDIGSQQQKWVKESRTVKRLRRLARLGQKDKDEREKTDKLEMYERRG